ncbi:hypothetical protein PIB30_093534 [Stylosanthes scabra]|uniref:Uncharacterized protein n=1 Tax=Stylosanthes scabra TaxID=79078 RepID=A0ABU6TY34_9FABA|nr:hypothetical protein [Stylosanthes scabra]
MSDGDGGRSSRHHRNQICYLRRHWSLPPLEVRRARRKNKVVVAVRRHFRQAFCHLRRAQRERNHGCTFTSFPSPSPSRKVEVELCILVGERETERERDRRGASVVPSPVSTLYCRRALPPPLSCHRNSEPHSTAIQFCHHNSCHRWCSSKSPEVLLSLSPDLALSVRY